MTQVQEDVDKDFAGDSSAQKWVLYPRSSPFQWTYAGIEGRDWKTKGDPGKKEISHTATGSPRDARDDQRNSIFPDFGLSYV